MWGVIRGATNNISNTLVSDDTAAMIVWFDASSEAISGTVGCVGYCMSGHYTTTVCWGSYRRPATSLYGVNLVIEKPDWSHLLLPK